MSTTGWDFSGELPPTDEEQGTLHERAQASPEFVALRRRLRRFVFPMTAAFLIWYLAFVLLASYARELMATPVLGGINLGLVVGLAQFATTFALTAGYVRYARRRLDPLASQIRDRVEAGAEAAAASTNGRLPAVPVTVAAEGTAAGHRDAGWPAQFGPDRLGDAVASARPGAR